MNSEQESSIESLHQQIAELKQSNAMLKRIIESVPLGIQIFDKEGYSCLINSAQKDILGVPNLETGIGEFNVLSDPYSKKIGASAIFEKAYKGEKSKHIIDFDFGLEENTWDTRRDRRLVEESIIPIALENGTVDYVVAVLDDITEKNKKDQALLESEERYRAIYDSISDCILVADLNGYIKGANRSACKTYGYRLNELIGLHATVLIHEDNHTKFLEFKQMIMEKGQYRGETVDLRKDGSTLSTEVRGTTFILKGEPYLVAIIRDVTDRKKHEKEREELINKLQHALEEIKTLQGILPMCSFCKKIRNDAGYWEQLEGYLTSHTNAKLSHGLCPECLEREYPETYKHMKEK